MQRPTSVSVIGWIYIAFGGLAVLSGAFGLAMSAFTSGSFNEAGSQSSAGDPILFRLMDSVFDYFWLLAAIQMVLAGLMVWSGIAFLRLRQWARTVIEAIAWLALVYNVVFGVLWEVSLFGMTSDMPRKGDALAAFPIIMGVFAGVMIVAFCIPLIVIIRVVRGRVVREAIAAAG